MNVTQSENTLREFLVGHYADLAPHTPSERLVSIIDKDVASVSWKQARALKIASYKRFQCLDGEGIRNSVYVSYCPFVCQGCFNASAQKLSYGDPYTVDVIDMIMQDMDNPHVSGITLAGGEPFLSAAHLVPLVSRIRDTFPDKTIWSYTGFLYEILAESRDEKRDLLDLVDVLIDGQFITEERDEINGLPFRGSNNQRCIDVPLSNESGDVVLHNC